MVTARALLPSRCAELDVSENYAFLRLEIGNLWETACVTAPKLLFIRKKPRGKDQAAKPARGSRRDAIQRAGVRLRDSSSALAADEDRTTRMVGTPSAGTTMPSAPALPHEECHRKNLKPLSSHACSPNVGFACRSTIRSSGRVFHGTPRDCPPDIPPHSRCS